MKISDEYMAGLFDGEGWFQIDRGNRSDVRRGISYQVHARICMRDSKLLKAVQKEYGGSFRQSKVATEKHAAYYTWDICGESVAAFAMRVASKLKLKNKQAKLAIRFQNLKRKNKNKPCSDKRHEYLTKMYDEMRRLNVKGVSR